MYKLFLIFWGFLGPIDGWQSISKGRTGPLERYRGYSDVSMMHFDVPEGVVSVSFVFDAYEEDQSIFGCSTRNVSLRLKQGAPPAINPDGAPFPDEFREISRPPRHALDFRTDRQPARVNLTSPEPGAYYAAVFLSYEDPRYQKISQQGLTQSCRAYVDATVRVLRIEKPVVIADQQLVKVLSRTNQSRYFSFWAPQGPDYAVIDVRALTAVTLRVAPGRPPSEAFFVLEKRLSNDSEAIFEISAQTLYYLRFDFFDASELSFTLRFHSSGSEALLAQNLSVDQKWHRKFSLLDARPYEQFTLARETVAESFTFSQKLVPELGSNLAIPLNVTAGKFVVLKFDLLANSDIGGTLQYILAFRPRLGRRNRQILIRKEPEDHFVVGCLQKNRIAAPNRAKNCVSDANEIAAPLVLNGSVTNATLLVPYPESGTWYATFGLFCGACRKCNCSEQCRNEYEKCQLNSMANCSQTILSLDECQGCDCQGDCLRNDSETCESSIVFDVSSRPCYYGDCGKQGRCGIVISEGVAYSTCLCTNNYRGYDCSDASRATPYGQILLEFLLLVLSNVFFLPAAVVAYKRRHRVQSLAFGSVFLSSTFYHACDAGENLLSFCLFRSSALQFADFFTAVLAVWLTLLTVADLNDSPVLQMAGTIAIAFSVALNRYALWLFAFPALFGLLAIGLNWYLKYRKYKGNFIVKKDYLKYRLPVGGAIVVLGLIIYGLLQTQANYKYLHSLWHVTMALGVVFVLPARGTFNEGASAQSSMTIEES